MRYIDADLLEPDTEWDDYEDGFISYSQLNIDTAETADVRENVKAMYIFDTHYGEWRCSNCGIVFEDYADEPPYNYCPNCGAQMMRGEA